MHCEQPDCMQRCSPMPPLQRTNGQGSKPAMSFGLPHWLKEPFRFWQNDPPASGVDFSGVVNVPPVCGPALLACPP